MLVGCSHQIVRAFEADNLIAEGVALAMPEEIEKFQSSSVLMRLPILCKFLATLPPTMLNHEFCDLAFCSYAWNDPKTQRCLANDADLSWSVFCSGAKDGASRLAAVLGAQTVSASTEEKQARPLFLGSFNQVKRSEYRRATL